jgi:rhamnosyltransferase
MDSMLLKPQVSVIIRTFNEEKHIGKLLSEVTSQKTSFPFEIIIVDSGSTDKTLDIISHFEVKLIQITPQEFTFGRSLNIGINAAQGDFCVMTSAHCYPVNQNWIENIVKPFENPNCSIVFGKQVGIDQTKYSERQIFNKWFPELNNDKTNIPFCNNANCAIRRSDWVHRKFDEELTGLEDMDYAKYWHNLKKDIAYRADAPVYHIHDETPKQIMNRYYREALAYKSIYKDQTFYFFDFLKFFFLNVFGDYFYALQDGALIRNFIEIPHFRLLQFWGTYKAHRLNKPISTEMQRRIFYPTRPSFLKKKPIKREIQDNYKFIDITHPLSENLPVWPGSKKFAITRLKTHEKDNFTESEISLNLHTGTHLDAPLHFVEGGFDAEEISLVKLNGEVLVMECMDRKEIGIDFFENSKIPRHIHRILLKTLNVNIYGPSKIFDPNFVAITPHAAKWLVDNGISVVGIDGPSIQLFHDPNNRTHEILLGAETIVIEGLNLKNVSPGPYKLICLPLKIPKAEGVPARAVLLQGQL